MTEVGENTPFVSYETYHGDIVVWRVCPNCGRFIKCGSVYSNKMGEFKFEHWECAKHGEIKPSWDWLS